MRRILVGFGDRLLAAVVPSTSAEAWECNAWFRWCECYAGRTRCRDCWVNAACYRDYCTAWQYGGNCAG